MDASQYSQRRSKASQEIVQAQVALHEGIEAEKRAASRGLGQRPPTDQSPATTTETQRQEAVTRQSMLKKLGSVKIHLDKAAQDASKGSDDDEAEIFPASMAQRVPGPVSPGSVLENDRRRSLGGQALHSSQSMAQQMNGQDRSPKSGASALRRSHSFVADSWLKLDLLDKGYEEEDLRSKLPLGNSVPDVIMHEPETKPIRRPSLQPPSQKGLLERLDQRFNSRGQLNVDRSFSTPSGPKSPSSTTAPRSISFSNGRVGGPFSLAESPSVFGKGGGESSTDVQANHSRRPANGVVFHPGQEAPRVIRPVGTQPSPTRKRPPLKSSKSASQLGSSPQTLRQPSLAHRSSKENSLSLAAAAAAVGAAAGSKLPFRSQVSDMVGSLL